MTNLQKHQYYKIFFKIRKEFKNDDEANYTNVLSTNDTVLRNVALYLAENYVEAYTRCSGLDDCSDYCKYLNIWLNEKKAMYTSNGSCQLHENLWKTYIEELWNKLESDKENKEWCKRNDDETKLPFPNDKLSSSCKNAESVDFSYTCERQNVVNAITQCPSSTCPSQISPASSTFGYVLFAFLAIGIFLFNCSPLKIWLNTLVGKKKIMRDYMNESENEEIDTNNTRDEDTSENRRMRMVYHSM
ncbi:PIR Superfamily Protein [Plasmodium ovale wallikeri]|uniref:PIR Superfamily Protein n=1 Tax=Plasmodium ovale wallikeri TaxID=864142 RepID=A0A1A9AL70_PLAOA|nr:PIR Superfamily Protein [Plasmodium ovale wallikeri]